MAWSVDWTPFLEYIMETWLCSLGGGGLIDSLDPFTPHTSLGRSQGIPTVYTIPCCIVAKKVLRLCE